MPKQNRFIPDVPGEAPEEIPKGISLHYSEHVTHQKEQTLVPGLHLAEDSECQHHAVSWQRVSLA